MIQFAGKVNQPKMRSVGILRISVLLARLPMTKPDLRTLVPEREPEEQAAWRFLDAVWNVPVGLGLCNNNLQFVRVNEALARFDNLAMLAHYDSDVLARLPAAFSDGLRRASRGEPHDVEFEANERTVRAKLHAILRPTDRAPVGTGIVALDVTDERKAFRDIQEANRLVAQLLADANARKIALSRLIESVQEGIILMTPDGVIAQVNHAAERILGHPRRSLVGARFQDERWWCADGSGNRDATSLLARAKEDADFVHAELYIETDAGRATLLADATALRDARGVVEDLVLSFRDVTAERHDLAAAKTTLDFQQQVIGIVGHDLRNPLATVTGSITLLRRQVGLSASSTTSLDRMERSAARMARLISDLLDYTRSRGPGGLPVVLSRADLHVICKDSVEECRTAHPSSQVLLETTGNATGSWDADRIEQALTNLIVNAIQHGGGGPVRVHSDATATKSVAITVSNGGAVIPADVLPELFKAYRRGIRGGSSNRSAGLGLGLFIVAQIAAAHGGRVYAESSAEAGTTFTIELPRAYSMKGP
jgi:PAS domain S-box-containing protein